MSCDGIVTRQKLAILFRPINEQPLQNPASGFGRFPKAEMSHPSFVAWVNDRSPLKHHNLDSICHATVTPPLHPSVPTFAVQKIESVDG